MSLLKELTIKYDVDALELGYTQHYVDVLEKCFRVRIYSTL